MPLLPGDHAYATQEISIQKTVVDIALKIQI